MADNNGKGEGSTHSYIDTKDYSKAPWKASEYANMRGVVDWGNLFQFAPYESGYCFLAVINGPYIGTVDAAHGGCSGIDGFGDLQDAFIKILEQEFKGLSGIGNITSDTMEISDGITSISLLGKVNQETNSQITMEFTEKSGSLITKYVSTYLRFVRDPKTEAKTYGGAITASNARDASPAKEVFNFLYIITDSTCLNIEKAFLILNAQPTEAAYSDLYNNTKGSVETKEIDVSFNAFVIDGSLANKLAHVYMRNLVKTGVNTKGKINLNSYDMNWSISGVDGKVLKAEDATHGGIASLNVDSTDGKISTNGNVSVSEAVTDDPASYGYYNPKS